jgi:hypothetical protein
MDKPETATDFEMKFVDRNQFMHRMKHTANRGMRGRTLLAVVMASVPAVGLAQTARRATQTQAQTAEVLGDLGDRQLMNELAARGLDSLLDRYFDVHKTPEAEQKAIRSMDALRDLKDPKVSNADKERRVRQIVEGMQTRMPNLDPVAMAEDADLLMKYGITHDENLLEYWGENPATEARLLPVAKAVYNMFGKASKDAAAQAAVLEKQINVNNQNTVGARWQKLDDFAHNAEYVQNVAAYDVALATPKAQRASVVDPALKYLKQFDDDQSQVMARVQVIMGKLALAKGDYDGAIALLHPVAEKDKTIQPPPEPVQQYEAKYFETVARLEAGKTADARKGLDALLAWEKTSMPADEQTQKGIAAAAEMLRYRIFLSEASHATDPAAKKTAEAAATNVLLELSKSRPSLRTIIYQQLIERLPKNAPIATMDPLLLRGLMSKAYDEAGKPSGTARDQDAQDILERGLQASQEMLTRKDPTITAALKDEAARLTPYLLEAMNKKVEAANAYLKYARDNTLFHPDAAKDALNDAGRLTFELRHSMPEDPEVGQLYDRFLPVAINPPFNRENLAFFYGQRLSALKKPEEAIKYYGKVAKSDRNYNNAQYASLEAMQEMLSNPKLSTTQRVLLTNELMRQAGQVRQAYATSPDVVARERSANATLIEAETAGADLKKPAQTLQLLTGFEQAVQGTPDEQYLVSQALMARVNANMELGQLKAATDMLVALLNQTRGKQGADYVHELLDRLDKNLDKAEAAHDTAAMRDIARSEADLSGFLVQWAMNNPNADIKKFTYQYKVFDARTKRLAGALAQDPATRQKLLTEALNSYTDLQKQPSVELYKATLDPAQVKAGHIDPSQPDAKVMLGIGLTDFELQDYKDAASLLGDLLNNNKLGGPTLLVRDTTGNDDKIVDNDVYWEATYKFYASSIDMAKGASDPALDGVKHGLKNLLVRSGIPVKWQDKFDDLRKQIIPDFSVTPLEAGTTQPATAGTPPVSKR